MEWTDIRLTVAKADASGLGRKGKRKVFSKSCSEMRNNSKKFFTKDANSRIFGARLRKRA